MAQHPEYGQCWVSFFFSFSLPNDFLNCGKIYITFTTLKLTVRWHLVNSWCLTLVYSFIVSCSWAWGFSFLKWEWCCEHWPRHLMWRDRLPSWLRWKGIFPQCRRPGFDPCVGGEDSLEKEVRTHSSILAWRTVFLPGQELLLSMEWQRAGHNWTTHMSSGQALDMTNRLPEYLWASLGNSAESSYHCIEFKYYSVVTALCTALTLSWILRKKKKKDEYSDGMNLQVSFEMKASINNDNNINSNRCFLRPLLLL